jgi:hypothetical protein
VSAAERELGPDEVGAHLRQRLAPAPQGVCRVEGRDEDRLAERVLLTAQLRDADLRVEQQLPGKLAQSDDDLGCDELDLTLEVWTAGVDLDRQRIAVVGGSALDHVGDVHPFAGDTELLEHQPVEQLTGTPDEWQTLTILLCAGTLSYEQQVGRRVTHAEDDLRPPRGQGATGAGAGLDGQLVQGGRHPVMLVGGRPRVAGGVQVARAVTGHLAHRPLDCDQRHGPHEVDGRVDEPGGRRHQGIAVAGRVRREHRPGETVVAALGDEVAPDLVEAGVGRDDTDRRVRPGPRLADVERCPTEP